MYADVMHMQGFFSIEYQKKICKESAVFKGLKESFLEHRVIGITSLRFSDILPEVAQPANCFKSIVAANFAVLHFYVN